MTSVKRTRMRKAIVAHCMQLLGHSSVETDETQEVFRLPDISAENRTGYLRRTNSVIFPYTSLLCKGASNSKLGLTVNDINIYFFGKKSFKLQ